MQEGNLKGREAAVAEREAQENGGQRFVGERAALPEKIVRSIADCETRYINRGIDRVKIKPFKN